MASSSIEQALYVRLTGDTDITADVGNRIFLALAEEGTVTPYIVYSVISDPHTPFAFADVNTGQPRIQFDVYTTDRYDALDISQNIRERLRHFQGTIDGMTVHQTSVGGTRLFVEAGIGGMGMRDIFHASLDVQAIYVDAS